MKDVPLLHRVLSLVLGTLVLATGLAGASMAYEAWCAERVYPGVRVWDVPVGGLRPADAASALAAAGLLDTQARLTLRGPERSWEVRLVDLGVTVDVQATARAAFEVGRQPGDGLLSHLRLLVGGANVAPVFSFDETVARLYLDALADQIYTPPVDAALVWEGGAPVDRHARTGRAVDVEATFPALRQAVTDAGVRTVDLVTYDLLPQVTDAAAAQAHLAGLLAQPFTLLLANPREGDPGPWPIPPEALATMLSVRAVGARVEVGLDETQARGYLSGLAPALQIEPVDARFHFNDATGQLVPITASTEGRALDVEASLAAFAVAVADGQHVASLVLQAVPPQYPDTATAEALGIVERVAVGDSYFIGSPSGRDNNIRVAAAKFDGIVVAPGETFSFNHYLGEVSVEEGYDEAYVTAGEQLAIEVGGGICQVSTTAFRAALWGGYPIVERWYHQHRVGYYELRGYGPGFDATVYSPLVDFKFTNDRSTPLLIEVEIIESAHQLIFRFYSTDDGRQVEVSEPQVIAETEPGPPIYQLDGTLEPGTVIEWQTAANGLEVSVERWVVDAQGQMLYYNTIVSRYDARRAAYHYGPGYEPPTE